jgi:hypothetical protein
VTGRQGAGRFTGRRGCCTAAPAVSRVSLDGPGVRCQSARTLNRTGRVVSGSDAKVAQRARTARRRPAAPAALLQKGRRGDLGTAGHGAPGSRRVAVRADQLQWLRTRTSSGRLSGSRGGGQVCWKCATASRPACCRVRCTPRRALRTVTVVFGFPGRGTQQCVRASKVDPGDGVHVHGPFGRLGERRAVELSFQVTQGGGAEARRVCTVNGPVSHSVVTESRKGR